jgi:hypothetical protein
MQFHLRKRHLPNARRPRTTRTLAFRMLLLALFLAAPAAAGAASILTIEDSGDGSGSAIGDMTLSADDTLRLYAVWRDDATGAFQGTGNADWTLFSPDKGTLVPDKGVATTFRPAVAGAVVIMASQGSAVDFTGIITVDPGVLDYVSVRSEGGGGGVPVDDVALTTDDVFTVHAAGYDADGNYLGDENVTWLTTGTLDAASGSGTSFDFDPATASTSGRIAADHASARDDSTGLVSVSVGALRSITVRTGPNGGGYALVDTTLAAGDTLVVFAAGYDADANYRGEVSASWSISGTLDPVSATGSSLSFRPRTAGTSGRLRAGHPSAVDDSTGIISVTAGALSEIRIYDAPDPGSGSPVGSRSLTTDDSLNLYCLGFDALGNFLGRESAAWEVTGGIGVFGSSSGDSTLFDPTRPGSGVVTAGHALVPTAQTGVIQVSLGGLDQVLVRDGPDGTGDEVSGITMTTDDTLIVHAGGYDADGNFIAAESVIWSTTGTLDPVAAAGVTFTFAPSTSPASGTIVADHPAARDDTTGTIVVTQGDLDHLLVRTAPGGGGVELGDTVLTAGDTLTLHAAGYDRDGNYRGEIFAGWSTTDLQNPQSAAGAVFDYAPAVPGAGRIVADAGPFVAGDSTGTVTTAAGPLDHVIALDAPGGSGTPVGAVEITADDSLTIHAAGFDRLENYLGDVSVDFATSGGLDPGASTGTSFVFRPITAPTSGTIILSHAIARGDTAGPVSVRPGAPSGTVGLVLSKPALTSDGVDSLRVTSLPVHDADGNAVEDGALVTVSASLGRITTDDAASGVPGRQITIAGGAFSFGLRSGTVPGPSWIQAGSTGVPGDLSGSVAVPFLAPPAVGYAGDTLSPRAAASGDTVSFSLDVVNTGGASVTLGPGTTLHFTDGNDGALVAALSGSPSIPSGTTRTISFQPVEVSPSLDAGLFTPLLDLAGSDQNGRPYARTDVLTQTEGFEVRRVFLREVSVSRPGSRTASAGDTVEIDLTVENPANADLDVTSVVFSFRPLTASTGNFGQIPFPGAPVPAGGTGVLTHRAVVLSGTDLGTFEVDARIGGTIGTNVVGDTASDRVDTLAVITGAAPAYLPGSLSPESVSAGEAYAFEARLANPGQSDLLLDRDTTLLQFGPDPDDPASRFEAALDVDSNALLEGGGAGTLVRFASGTIPPAIAGDAYTVRLVLRGTANELPFVDTLYTTGDSVQVDAPPLLAYRQGSLAPRVVTQGATAVFSLGVVNAGEADLALDPAGSRLWMADGPDTLAVTPAGAFLLTAGDTTSVTFSPGVVPSGLGPGTYAPTLQISGSHNGRGLDTVLTALADSVLVLGEPDLAIASITPNRATVTAGMTAPWTVDVRIRNDGGADVVLDSCRVRTFLLTEGGREVTGGYGGLDTAATTFAGGGSLLAAGGGERAVRFTVSPTDTSTGTVLITGSAHLHETAGGTAYSLDTGSGGGGLVTVQEPALLRITGVLPSRSTVVSGQTAEWVVRVALTNASGAGSSGSVLEVLPLDPSTRIDLSPGSWPSIVDADSLQSGDPFLLPGESDTLVYRVPGTPVLPSGPVEIRAAVRGVEVNSGRSLADSTGASGAASIDLLQPGLLVVDTVRTDRPSVTMSQEADWTVTVGVSNPGEAPVRIDLADTLGTRAFVPSSAGFQWARPVSLSGGGTGLAGGSSDELRFVVTHTGVVAAPGMHELRAAVSGSDLVSGAPVGDDTETAPGGPASAVRIDLEPVLSYVPGTLAPTAVNQGTQVAFRLDVSNRTGASTAMLDPASTLFTLDDGTGGTFEGSLDPLSPRDIPPDSQVTLVFDAEILDPGFATGIFDPDVALVGWENGNPLAPPPLSTSPERVTVQEAPDLRIVSVRADRGRVTAGSAVPWTVRMVVENRGATDLDLLLVQAGDTTDVGFSIGADVTSEYAYVYPDSLAGSGGTLLAAGSTDTLAFRVTATGTTTGLATVSGTVTARNVVTGELVAANTFAGGSGSVRVEAPPEVRVTSVVSSHPALTLGQPTSWNVRVALENRGEAAAAVDTSATTLVFTGGGTFPPLPDPVSVAGGTVAGGGTDTLVFSLAGTGTVPGSVTIDSDVSAFDVNMGNPVSVTPPPAPGGLLLQEPPLLRLTTVSLHGPNPPRINRGQTLPLAFTLANQGEAPADSILLAVSHGGSSVQPESLVVLRLAGGAVRTDSVQVTAEAVSGTEDLKLSILRAVDGNSPTPLPPALYRGGHPDSAETMVKQAPAAARVLAVKPVPPVVRAGQTADWTVRVLLDNPGEADLRLDVPAAGDLTFIAPGGPAGDYLVVPPSGLASGVGLVLPGGAVPDSLIYTVSTTGADTGRVAVNASVRGHDVNDEGVRSDSGSDSVRVRAPSRLFVASVTTDARNQPLPDHSYLDTGQATVVTIRVRNDGGEDADSVTVRLTADPLGMLDSLAVSPGSDSVQAVPASSGRDFVFRVRAGPLPASLVALEGRIVSALSAVTGEPLPPGPSSDDGENLVIQSPARLLVNAGVTAPAAATDDTLSTGQNFTLSAQVANTGQAELEGPARLHLDLPTGFSSLDSLERDFTPGSPVPPWGVRAPGAPGTDTLRVSLAAVPLDANTGVPAPVEPTSRASFPVAVVAQAFLSAASLEVESPAGARDGTISTEQSLRARARISATPAATSLRATLSATGLTILGASTLDLVPEGGGVYSASWDLEAPAVPGPASVAVSFSAQDENSGVALGDVAGPLSFTVRLAPDLALTPAAVVSPPVATNGLVTRSMEFQVATAVVNAGGAGVDTTGARVRIAVPSGYALLPGESPLRSFAPGDSLSWWMRAPDAPTGRVDNVVVSIETPYPDDENTGRPALVSVPTTSVGIQTEEAALTIANVTSPDVPPRVVPYGERDLLVLRFLLENLSTERAVLQSLALTVLDRNGSPVGRVSSVLSGLRVLGRTPSDPADLGSNPALVTWSVPDTLDPAGRDTLTVFLDVSRSPALPEFRITTADPSDVRVIDLVSGGSVGVGLAGPGTFAQALSSRPVVLMSRSFEDYTHNYPNPFRAGSEATRIAYYLDRDGPVTIEIFTLLGDPVWKRDFAPGDPEARIGPREVLWDGRNEDGRVVRNGLYVCRVSAPAGTAVFRIAVAK